MRGGGGEGEERKGKREEKPDTKALRRVFRPLDEHDVSQITSGHATVMSAMTAVRDMN